MKILFTAKYIPKDFKDTVGGVQSWINTLKYEFDELGHSCQVADEAAIGHLQDTFDLGIVAHIEDSRKALRLCKEVRVVSHGIIGPENPTPFSHNYKTFYTSEEVRDRWKGNGEILRQPINLDYWKPRTLEKSLLLRVSNCTGLNFLPDMAPIFNVAYTHAISYPKPVLLDLMQKSLAVYATGRAALEAMACGAPVVLCDHRGHYQGPLIDPNIYSAMKRNYSGRGGVVPTPENIFMETNRAISRGSLRHIVAEHHNSKDIAKQILS